MPTSQLLLPKFFRRDDAMTRQLIAFLAPRHLNQSDKNGDVNSMKFKPFHYDMMGDITFYDSRLLLKIY